MCKLIPILVLYLTLYLILMILHSTTLDTELTTSVEDAWSTLLWNLILPWDSLLIHITSNNYLWWKMLSSLHMPTMHQITTYTKLFHLSEIHQLVFYKSIFYFKISIKLPMIIDAHESILIMLAYCLLLWNLLWFFISFLFIFLIIQALEIPLWNLWRRPHPRIHRCIESCIFGDISYALIIKFTIIDRVCQGVLQEESLDGLTWHVKITVDLIHYSDRLWSIIRSTELDLRLELLHAVEIYEFSIQAFVEHSSNV